ncbi:MAG: hypothetical protein OHK0013_12310 [Sandaracinaceae bacterium]
MGPAPQGRSDRGSVRTVVWGPFPIPWLLVGWMLTLFGFTLGAVYAAVPGALTCRGGRPLVCRRTGLLDAPSRIEVDDARVEERTTEHRGYRRTFTVVVLDRPPPGPSLTLWESGRDEAEHLVRALRDLRAQPGQQRTFSEPLHELRVLLALALSAFLLLILWTAAAEFAPYVFDVEPGRAELRQARRVAGLRWGARSIRTDRRPEDVRVQFEGPPPDPTRMSPPPAARLVVVADGREIPLTERFHSGIHVHVRAARALRAALECPPRAAAIEASEQALVAALDEHARLARRAWRGPGAWIGAFTGAIVGLLAGWFSDVLVYGPSANDEAGWLAMLGLFLGVLTGVGLAFHFTRRDRPIP